MSQPAVILDADECEALRTCARLCWQHRAELKLAEPVIDDVLVAWMAIGTTEEGQAASELLSARRERDAKQANFDGVLNRPSTT